MRENTPEELKKDLLSAYKKQAKSSFSHNLLEGTVTYNIDPSALPLKIIDVEKFYTELCMQFNLSFDNDELTKLLPNVDISPTQGIKILIDNEKNIIFRNGLMQLQGLQNITSIKYVIIGEQNLSVSVVGSTNEAEYLAKYVWLMLWKDLTPHRTTSFLEQKIMLSRYNCVSELSFSNTISDFLHPKFLAEFKTLLEEPDSFVKIIGLTPYCKDDIREHFQENKLILYCSNITLTLVKMNETTGESEDCTITIDLRQRTQANKKVIRFRTELPTSEHIKLVSEFAEMLKRE